jgi:hypothetical protein
MMYKSMDLSVKDKIILTSCMFIGLTGVYFLDKYLNKYSENQINQMKERNRREIVTEVLALIQEERQGGRQIARQRGRQRQIEREGVLKISK